MAVAWRCVLIVLGIALMDRPIDAEEVELEAARARILAAARKQTTVHHALDFTSDDPLRTVRLHAECFHDGDLGGVAIWLREGEGYQEVLFVVADGQRIVKRARGVGRPEVLSKRELEAAVRRWAGARARLTERYPSTPTRRVMPQLGMHVIGEGTGVTLSVGLSFDYVNEDEAVLFEWCNPSVWNAARMARVSEDGTTVTVAWHGFDMTLALASGLPVAARIPTMSAGGKAQARAVATRLTAEAWRKEIRSGLLAVKDQRSAAALWSAGSLGEFLRDLLGDVLPEIPPYERTKETMAFIAGAVAPPLALPEGPDASRAWEGIGTVEDAGLRAGALACAKAAAAGWSELEAFQLGREVMAAYLAARKP